MTQSCASPRFLKFFSAIFALPWSGVCATHLSYTARARWQWGFSIFQKKIQGGRCCVLIVATPQQRAADRFRQYHRDRQVKCQADRDHRLESRGPAQFHLADLANRNTSPGPLADLSNGQCEELTTPPDRQADVFSERIQGRIG